MTNLKDKHGSGYVKQGTKKPFLPCRFFPLQYQQETNSLSFCENQMMSRSLLTEERSVRQTLGSSGQHTLPAYGTHTLPVLSEVIYSPEAPKRNQKVEEPPLLQTLAKLHLSPRPAI